MPIFERVVAGIAASKAATIRSLYMPAAAVKAPAKSIKPRGKDPALQEVTKVASKVIGSPGDTAASKRANKHRSPSPSVSPDNRSNPRFVARELGSGSEGEAEPRSTHNTPLGFLAVKAKGSLTAGDDEIKKSLKHIMLAEGLARAKTTKATTEDARSSKKHTSSKSPFCEEKVTGYSYRGLFRFSDEEEQEQEEDAIYSLQAITNDLY
ncbi:hypothetical protein PInf_009371 [Phytophthora infestans]|nr:hypothetical protein PInf_009371 [Phytophthora infestans]